MTETECPYAERDVQEGYDAVCSRMAWREEAVDFRTTVAVFTPDDANGQTPIVYIPGGPGDAPVNEGGDVASILSLFPGRTVVTLNPRGVKGAEPRPSCTFAADFWHEELTSQRETEITAGCRDAVDLDLTPFDAPYLAQDISRMVRGLGIERAGVFGVSYGTESVLHLLAEKPDWLELAIIDSLSLPGVLGTRERLKARDRFLGVIDRICFEEKQCAASVTSVYSDLTTWAAQFDKTPVKITLGPDNAPWSLDSQDMIDFLASMASYPDGAGYGPIFIEVFQDSPDTTAQWVASEMESGFGYAIDNFALLYAAFSDSAERKLPPPKAGDTRYPFNVHDQREFARLFKVWNQTGRTEARFVGPNTETSPVGVPVLILSGGADSLTPLEWADEVEQRFSGLTRFVFPELGHAVSFGTDADVTDKDVAVQLNCGPDVVRAFMSGEDYGECERFLRKATDD